MKSLKVLLLGIALMTGITSFAGNFKNGDAQQEPQKTKVEVYYFHFNTRCVTCRTVESEAKMNVEELFGSDVKFSAVNLDDRAGEAKGKELGINSMMLVVVKGDTKIELTTDGFLYAQTNPQRFRKVMEDKIKPLL